MALPRPPDRLLAQLPQSLAQRLPLLALASFLAGALVAGWTAYGIFERRTALLVAETSGPALVQILAQAPELPPGIEAETAPYLWTRTPNGFAAEAAHTVPLILTLGNRRYRVAAVFNEPPKLPDLLRAGSAPMSPERRLGSLSRAIARQDSGATLAVFLADGSTLTIAAPSLWRDRLEETKVALIGLAGFLLTLAAIVPLAMNLAAPFQRLAGRGSTRLPPLASSEAVMVRDRIDQLKETFAAEQEQRVQGLAAISHDLRTPVTRLRLRTALLEDEAMHAKFSSDLDEISTIIDSALDLLSIRHQSEQSHRFSLSALAESLVDDYRDTGQDVCFEGQEALSVPGLRTLFGQSGPVTIHAPGHSMMRGQPDKLRRALSNLIDNGLKYGGRVTVSIAAAGGGLEAAVRDFGPGLPPGQSEELLRPFVRGHSGTGSTGMGLGLAIAQEIAELHGGSLRLENANPGVRAVLHVARGFEPDR
ncbi:sensor histidine kinase [Roseobacteraceae bacterium NS-SX3]